MNYSALQTTFKSLISKFGVQLQLEVLDTGKKVSFIGVFGKDEEYDLNDTSPEASHMLTRKRILYVPGDISVVPTPGDSIIDKSAKTVKLTGDTVGGSSRSYHINHVEYYAPAGSISCAYRLEVEG